MRDLTLKARLGGLSILLLAAAGGALEAASPRGGMMPVSPSIAPRRDLTYALPMSRPFGVVQQYAISTRPGHIGRILAPVMLNGRGPFRFLLDTGATRTVLAAATLAKLNLRADDDAKVVVRGVSGSIVVSTVHVNTVDSGAMHFQDLDAPVLSGAIMDGIDGILGMDGLKGMTLSADFTRDRVVIGDLPTRTPATFGVTGRFVSERLLMIEGQINGVRTLAVIDTGALHTLGNAALLARLGHGRALSLKAAVIDATENTQPAAVQRIAEMRVGAASIRDMSVTFGDYQVFKTWGIADQPALLLGMDVLGSLADFTIDYHRGQLLLQPWPTA